MKTHRPSLTTVRKPVSSRGGFTLLELVVTVVIIGLVTAVSVPKISETRRQLAIDGAARQLQADLARARIEALRRNTLIKVSQTSDTTYSITFLGTRTLPNGAAFTVASADTLKFAAFGPSPMGAQTMSVHKNGHIKSVKVNSSGKASRK